MFDWPSSDLMCIAFTSGLLEAENVLISSTTKSILTTKLSSEVMMSLHVLEAAMASEENPQ